MKDPLLAEMISSLKSLEEKAVGLENSAADISASANAQDDISKLLLLKEIGQAARTFANLSQLIGVTLTHKDANSHPDVIRQKIWLIEWCIRSSGWRIEAARVSLDITDSLESILSADLEAGKSVLEGIPDETAARRTTQQKILITYQSELANDS